MHSCFRVTGTRSVLCFICYFNRIFLLIFINSGCLCVLRWNRTSEVLLAYQTKNLISLSDLLVLLPWNGDILSGRSGSYILLFGTTFPWLCAVLCRQRWEGAEGAVFAAGVVPLGQSLCLAGPHVSKSPSSVAVVPHLSCFMAHIPHACSVSRAGIW